MERDCYQVEVLYYLNPHLIWVEVVETSQRDFVFEQIGIYGILPFETTIDGEGEGLKGQRCEDWVAATTVLMKKCFMEAKQVWFRPTHIDRRTSIFDDNIHKYGEIILKSKDNRQIELSKVLISSGFALHNICLFHQELGIGNLKTKLNHAKTQEIIQHLEKDMKTTKKHRTSTVKKQTTVFQAANNLESTLTETNLRKHNNYLCAKIDAILTKKSKDFDRCKDIDDESLGRASNSKKVDEKSNVSATKETASIPLILKKKLELTNKRKPKLSDPLQVLIATKQYLEANAIVQDDSSKSENSDPNNLKKTTSVSKDFNKFEDSTVYHDTQLNKIDMNGAQKNTPYPDKVPTEEMVLDNRILGGDVSLPKGFKPKKHRSKKTKVKIPEYDMATEKRVAYGPPGIQGTRLALKIVPIKQIQEEVSTVSNLKKEYQDIRNTQEMYAAVDSDVDIEITNKSDLKDKFDNLVVNDRSKISNQTLDSDDLESTRNDSLDNSSKAAESLNVSLSKSALLQKKLDLFKSKKSSSVTSNSDTTNKDSSSDVTPKKRVSHSSDEDISELVEKVNSEYQPKSIRSELEKRQKVIKARADVKNNVNPFKNIDASLSVFVDKLVTPVLMVHNKMNYRIEPCSNIRDVHFNTHIHIVLKNLGVERPMMLQMVSWPVILRGYSLFMIGPLGSGKTFGYLPAVCRLITDDSRTDFIDSAGPTCIIVCATAQSVAEVEHYARMFLGVEERVVSCYAGMEELHITTSLLNGCDLFICTPSVLVRLLQLTDFGIDLRRLSTFVLEDCERLSETYASEVKYFLIKIREMLKTRVNKELKVQFVVASRIWCDFMESLAKRTPNSVVCIGAFQECVLYSKANTSVDFLKKENKMNKVLDFLKDVDGRKKTVVVCRSNDEVDELSKVLMKNKYEVFACNENMTVEELYSLSKSWQDYQEPVLAPVLVCCDGNLNHLNVSDAHNLLHYSLPHLFSMFCKRFSVLNDNYASIFREDNESVKIKVFLEDTNMEQLPKILHFVKRCTEHVPEFLDGVCEKVLQEKDATKAKKFVPICDNVLAFGECPDYWNCQERHAVFKDYDEPKDWMPRHGVVTFKILHYHTPAQYSVRLLSSTSNGKTKKYPQTYSTLSLKLGMYFSKESNKKLHGIPNVGDVCAVSVKQSFYVRCQVLKILTRYNNGTPNCVLIKLIDEEKLEKTRDIHLYYLPDELKKIETHIVQMRLANVCPKDKDITFSNLAKDMLKEITANGDDLYMRGKVVLTVGNCILIDTLEACQELTSLNETVVMHNLKKELLSTHAIANPEHIAKLGKLCQEFIVHEEEIPQPVEVKYQKEDVKPQWAHLEDGDMSAVFFASAESPDMFFVRLAKFESCMNLLLKDIAKYIECQPKSLQRVTIGDVVLAKFPDDAVFERARIDDIISEKVVRCFFVDQGDWRDVQMNDLVKIPSKFVAQMPFQAIECRLVGVRPAGDNWTDFGTNWFYDNCFATNGDPKMLYAKYFTREHSQNTGGRKYGVAIIDTGSDQDVVINQLMIDLNLAQENDDEIVYLQELDLNKYNDKVPVDDKDLSSDEDELDDLPKPSIAPQSNSLVPVNSIVEKSQNTPPNNVFMKQPIRSVPLVDSDNESSDSWDIVNPKDLVAMLKGVTSMNVGRQSQKDDSNYKYNTGPIAETVNIKNNIEAKTDTVKNDANSKRHFEITKTSDLAKNHPDNRSLNEIKSNVTFLKSITNENNVAGLLDSDDLSSADGSQLSQQSVKPKIIEQGLQKETIDSLRKPKLLWRQNKTSVSIKILLIGSESYDVKLQERTLKFEANCNDVNYGFDFDLYGVVNDIVHSDKGQYILVKLNKVLKKNWLTLTKDGAIRKWIVYDVDSIDTSSDEEDIVENTLAGVLKELNEKDCESNSDDDFLDDISYEYKRDV